MLIYFSPRVISSICKYWFRIRQPRALLGVECFQGCQSIEKIQGLVLQWELCLAKAEPGSCPSARTRLGWAGQRARDGSVLKGSLGALLWSEWHWRVRGQPELNEAMLEGMTIRPWIPRPYFCLHCSLRLKGPSHIRLSALGGLLPQSRVTHGLGQSSPTSAGHTSPQVVTPERWCWKVRRGLELLLVGRETNDIFVFVGKK